MLLLRTLGTILLGNALAGKEVAWVDEKDKKQLELDRMLVQPNLFN